MRPDAVQTRMRSRNRGATTFFARRRYFAVLFTLRSQQRGSEADMRAQAPEESFLHFHAQFST